MDTNNKNSLRSALSGIGLGLITHYTISLIGINRRNLSNIRFGAPFGIDAIAGEIFSEDKGVEITSLGSDKSKEIIIVVANGCTDSKKKCD